MASQYQYQPLARDKNSFRLLYVLPARSPEGYVQCELFHTTTDDMMEAYTCLSYVWGYINPYLPLLELPVKLFIVMNGIKVRVQYNLYHFLEIAHKKYNNELLWIDALCIDQSNSQEQNHQVSQMGNIYSRAKQVIAWLGPWSSVSGPNPLESLQPGRSASWNYWNILRYKTWRGSADASQFFDAADTYWSRAWITQELALARHVLLMIDQVDLDLSLVEEDALVFTLGNQYRRPNPGYPEPTESSIYRIWQLATDKKWREIRNSPPNPRNLLVHDRLLFSLLTRFRGKQSHYGRDRIYSLRGLCSEEHILDVDYKLSSKQLLNHVVAISHKPLCFCSASALVEALETGANERRLSSFLVIKLANRFDRASNSSLKCSACGASGAYKPSFMDPKKDFDALLCLGEICTGWKGHLGLHYGDRYSLTYLHARNNRNEIISPVWPSQAYYEHLGKGQYEVGLSVPYILKILRASNQTNECRVRVPGRMRFVAGRYDSEDTTFMGLLCKFCCVLLLVIVLLTFIFLHLCKRILF
jgi:hypothetical protein